MRSANRFARVGPKVSVGTLFGVITIVLYVSYSAGILKGKKTVPPLLRDISEEAKNYVLHLQEEIEDLQEKLIKVERDYQIQRETQKNLQNHLKELQAQNIELLRDLSLYQSIAGTPQPGKGVHIKLFHLFETEQVNKFRYLLILSKQSAPQAYVQGFISMTIRGNIGVKPASLEVKYVDSPRMDGLAFKFRQLQELAGELSFPEQFVPKEVIFQVNPDKDWPSFQQSYEWAVQNPDES